MNLANRLIKRILAKSPIKPTKVPCYDVKARIQDKEGKLIPVGVTETYQAKIIDGLLTFWFNDVRTTKRWVDLDDKIQAEKGLPSRTSFSLRLNKATTQYPGWSKDKIKEMVENFFKEHGKSIEKSEFSEGLKDV